MRHKASGTDERADASRDERAKTTRDEAAPATRDESVNVPRAGRARTTRGGDVWRRIVLASLACAYVVLWVGGVVHYLFIGAVADGQRWLASAFLSVAGLIVLFAATSRRAALQLVGVAALGFFFELCGVRYGWPFGRYAYTGVLQPAVFGVPLVMAFAWMSLVAYVQQARLRLNAGAWGGALTAAVWMTAIDLVIDPLAANELGYWRWVEGGSYYGIPLSNFAGWFVCSLSLFVLFRRRKMRQPNLWHRLTGASIILFFTLIALSFQLYAAALVGFALCAADVLIGIVQPNNLGTKREVRGSG
jgi:putative membrane protein